MLDAEKDGLLGINLNHLEKDASEQPRLLRIWIDKLARADRDAKYAKNALRLVTAEWRKVIRSNPSKYNIAKITEDSVEDVLVTMTIYKEAQEVLVKAEYDRDRIKAMVSALHERGEQLSNEVKLHGQAYFAPVRTDPETRQKVSEMTQDNAMTDIFKNLNKPKKSKRQ